MLSSKLELLVKKENEEDQRGGIWMWQKRTCRRRYMSESMLMENMLDRWEKLKEKDEEIVGRNLGKTTI